MEQLEDKAVIVERKIFAHQYYNRLLVTHITARRKDDSNTGQIVIKISSSKNYSSDDFNFEPLVNKTNSMLDFFNNIIIRLNMVLQN